MTCPIRSGLQDGNISRQFDIGIVSCENSKIEDRRRIAICDESHAVYAGFHRFTLESCGTVGSRINMILIVDSITFCKGSIGGLLLWSIPSKSMVVA